MIYTVLLVDDEPYVIEDLKKIIDWHKLSYKIIGEANDVGLFGGLKRSLKQNSLHSAFSVKAVRAGSVGWKRYVSAEPA